MIDALHDLAANGVAVWLDDLSRFSIASGNARQRSIRHVPHRSRRMSMPAPVPPIDPADDIRSKAVHAKAIALGKLAIRATTSAGSGHPTTALSLAHLVTVLM